MWEGEGFLVLGVGLEVPIYQKWRPKNGLQSKDFAKMSPMEF